MNNQMIEQFLRSLQTARGLNGDQIDAIGNDVRASFLPMIIERSAGKEMAWDPISRLSKDRNIFIVTPINDTVAFSVMAQLLVLDAIDSSNDITIYIMSPGGQVTSGLAIHDTMKLVKCDVRTIGIGHCESMGAFLLTSGTKGKRLVTPSWRGMIHQPLGGAGGQVTDVEIHANEMKRLKEILTRYMAEYVGRSYDEVHLACERDNFMSPEEAVQFGLVDGILKFPEKK